MLRLSPTSECTLLVVALAVAASRALAGALRVADAVWAGGTTWDTVLTPSSFESPPRHTACLLFDFGMSGLAGQRSIADSHPGRGDYAGGRWWVQMVVFTPAGLAVHDADGDGIVDAELTSAEELEHHLALGHLEIVETETRFECPLLK